MQRNLPSAGGQKGQKPSPAQMQEMYAQFGAWQAKFKQNLVDMGGKLGQGRLVTTQPAADGPFVEVKELVGGYMIVSAESLDAAIEVARACPGLVRPGSGVEVIEIHTP
jgi:hypothetical protein